METALQGITRSLNLCLFLRAQLFVHLESRSGGLHGRPVEQPHGLLDVLHAHLVGELHLGKGLGDPNDGLQLSHSDGDRALATLRPLLLHRLPQVGVRVGQRLPRLVVEPRMDIGTSIGDVLSQERNRKSAFRGRVFLRLCPNHLLTRRTKSRHPPLDVNVRPCRVKSHHVPGDGGVSDDVRLVPHQEDRVKSGENCGLEVQLVCRLLRLVI
mmetsp:Transcript_47963/g.94651  ORF Transcript_47963/g.94651 Transcript_47963/m.94651 type:complete len:212 (-) Transcript_47963:1766-2401(-)